MSAHFSIPFLIKVVVIWSGKTVGSTHDPAMADAPTLHCSCQNQPFLLFQGTEEWKQF